jgi:hypothetical protein
MLDVRFQPLIFNEVWAALPPIHPLTCRSIVLLEIRR